MAVRSAGDTSASATQAPRRTWASVRTRCSTSPSRDFFRLNSRTAPRTGGRPDSRQSFAVNKDLEQLDVLEAYRRRPTQPGALNGVAGPNVGRAQARPQDDAQRQGGEGVPWETTKENPSAQGGPLFLPICKPGRALPPRLARSRTRQTPAAPRVPPGQKPGEALCPARCCRSRRSGTPLAPQHSSVDGILARPYGDCKEHMLRTTLPRQPVSSRSRPAQPHRTLARLPRATHPSPSPIPPALRPRPQPPPWGTLSTPNGFPWQRSTPQERGYRPSSLSAFTPPPPPQPARVHPPSPPPPTPPSTFPPWATGKAEPGTFQRGSSLDPIRNGATERAA